LPYLDAVLRETLRLYPPAYSIGREALEDTEIGGCTIPRGAQVWMFQWAMQRDPRFYREPDLFRHERASALDQGVMVTWRFIAL
jgi:cytochrome P450